MIHRSGAVAYWRRINDALVEAGEPPLASSEAYDFYKGLRRILLASDGVSARIVRMLNDVAIEAIETGVERITDEALERYKPVGEWSRPCCRLGARHDLSPIRRSRAAYQAQDQPCRRCGVAYLFPSRPFGRRLATIANPDTLNAVRDETILRGEERSNAYARQLGSKLKRRGKAIKCENIFSPYSHV